MHFNVPQFVNIEDRIAFQLTGKQLGWFALGGVILFFVWQVAVTEVFFIWVFVIGGIAILFAFFKPYGTPFPTFLANGFKYLVYPKILVWRKAAKGDKFEKRSGERLPGKKVKMDRFIKEKELKKANKFADVLDKQSKI